MSGADGGDAGTSRIDSGERPRDAGRPNDAGDPRDSGASPDAGPPEPCAPPGSVEEVACGSCGTTQRFCSSTGFWANGPCTGEGECAPGAERDGSCGNCGARTDLCTEACTWESSGSCTDEGECAPGTRTRSGAGCPDGQTRDVACSAACAFEPDGACEADGCDAPGATEVVACGSCGTQERFCTSSRVWSYGACEGEGACVPGTSDVVSCGNCGTRAARCSAACVWDATGACESEGVCAPGASSRTSAGCPAGQSRLLTCNDACTYAPGACEIDECVPGTTTSVPCGMCGTRLRTCDATRRWVDGACTGEGVCAAGTTGSQSCGRCGTQVTLCSTSCAWVSSGSCTGEGSCAAGTTSRCTTSCGSTGTQACSATCTPGACTPPAETCNGVDDDCDGSIDEGCSTCVACAGSTPVTGTGGRYDVPLAPHSRVGSCGGSGSEGVLSLTLTETSDVFVTTHGAPGDTVVYVRNCNCNGTEIGCSDDADGRLSAALRLTSLAPGNYGIIVDTEAAISGTIPVDVYVTPAGVRGDRCGNPQVLAAGATRLTGNTCTMADDYDIVTDSLGCPMAAGGDGADAVYYFSVPSARTVTFSACGAGNDFDGTLYIRSACNGTTIAQQVACDDDGCAAGLTTCEGYRPSVTASLAAGLYYLVVDGYVFTSFPPTCPSCGNFDIAITGL